MSFEAVKDFISDSSEILFIGIQAYILGLPLVNLIEFILQR
jgi:hypothetical protein